MDIQEIRGYLEDRLHEDYACDVITSKDWTEVLNDFDCWAKSAKPGDTYTYNGVSLEYSREDLRGENLYESFLGALEDEVIFHLEGDKDEHFMDFYLGDYGFMRSLLTTNGQNPFEQVTWIAEHEEDYQTNFYAEYYPHTDEVALKIDIEYFDDVTEKKIKSMFKKSADTLRLKDFYIQLTDDEKDCLRKALKDYAHEELQEFLTMEDEEEKDL